MRRITVLFISCMLVLGSTLGFAFEYQGLNYSVLSASDKTVSVSKGSGELTGEVIIPEMVSDGGVDYTVVEIAANGFTSCQGITALTMPSTIIKIGMDAFLNCPAMESVVLSENLEVLDKYAFNSCVKLKSMSFPASLKSIGKQAFANCLALEYFEVDEANSNYTANSGVLFSKDMTTLVAYPNSRGSSYEVPESVTEIGESAFFGCQDVTSIVLHDKVDSILEGAFYMCSSLEEMVLPAGLTTLADWTFAYCVSLASVELPDGITAIGNDCFAGCSKLTSVEIPDAVKQIGNQAFHSCSDLNKLVWGKNVEIVGSEAFSGCKVLETVEILSPVTEIGLEAFYGCASLKKLTLPAELESLGDAIVMDCVLLDTVVCHAMTPPACTDFSFYAIPADCKLYVPSGTRDSYAKAKGWSDFKTITEQGGSSVTEAYADGLHVWAENGMLVIEGLNEPAQIVVYGLNGCKIAELDAVAGRNVYSLPSGLYVIRCGQKAVKVYL